MLALNGLTKTFGAQTAVKELSFNVAPGEIMGLIGQNGAGKTTTFRMILNFLHPDQGAVLWDGRPMAAQDRAFIGYLPEERGLYPKMRVADQIVFFAELHGLKRADALSRLDEWLDRFQVKGKPSDKVKDLSKGNQQKVQLIATLIHMPKLLILDEPFSGLDPVNAGLLEDGIRLLKANGSAIIFSSHDMSNVEEISDHLVMLRNGETVLNGRVSEIRQQFGRTRLYLEDPPLSRDELAGFAGVEKVEMQGSRYKLTLSDPAAGKALFSAVTARGYVTEFSQQPPTLDEIFRMKAGVVQ
ncbi:ABC transporter ATP-binding protein [Schleiferilactobacillus shenzhenensis]|uniref:YhaQ n=1 Tax=Schleiferilactobacillus shenzhenensis LY-73 TaxID=1231336 RepID=U4TRI5_9LACO|nr:ABC transporter ATP-binding protein [Schleiferilactobacillus shenzhenensis]ERL64117.1 YhaQ [Schleiferilactobacillus shenzhenensis LY-73]